MQAREDGSLQVRHCGTAIPRRSLGLDRFERVLLVVAALILVYQLAVPPIVGIRDQGDYWKVMAPAGFWHVSDTPADMHEFFNSKFQFKPPGWMNSHYISSATLLARLARAIGLVVSKEGLFDIRVLGLLQGAVLLGGLALIMAGARGLRTPSRRVLALLLVWIFTDVGYVAFLNSFYTQTASLLFLLVATGCLALTVGGDRARGWWWLGFVAAAALFVASKPQEALQAPLLAIVAGLAGWWALPRRFATGLGLAGAVCLLAVGGWLFVNKSPEVSEASFYNAVFGELLGHSPDGKADLQALGLSPDLLRYAGTHAFERDLPVHAPSFRAAFYDKVGYGALGAFYATHPGRLWALIARRSSSAFTLVTGYGNFERSAGFAQHTQSGAFRGWSDFKKWLLPGTPWMLAVLLGGTIAGGLALWRRAGRSTARRLGAAAFVVLGLMAVNAFLICAIGDNLDSIRQLYAFNAMTDLCLVAGGVFVVEAARRAVEL
jgi:hypothetical protein